MIGITVNPHSVYVPVIQSECLEMKLDSTYPVHLNGIISQDEFRESINRINHANSSSGVLTILCIFLTLGAIGGVTLFITSIESTNKHDHNEHFYFAPVGIILLAFVGFFSIFACAVVYSRRERRMRKAIAEESMKYSSRSPIPCSWRLENSRHRVGEYGHHQHLDYHLVIDIGHSIAKESQNRVFYSNQVIPESTTTVEPDDNNPPPPYSDQLVELCSSHKQLFNKY